MNGTDFSVADEIAQVTVERPHVVLLGAGASRAAFPNGERHGKQIPLMFDFAEIVPVKQMLEDSQVEWKGRNFEDIYMEIDSDVTKLAVKREIEDTVFQYFSSLGLRDEPTIYDHLLLSLRPKDVIATFNWDPFLIQAASRRNVPEMPKIAFLHGNVLEGLTCLDFLIHVELRISTFRQTRWACDSPSYCGVARRCIPLASARSCPWRQPGYETSWHSGTRLAVVH